jgi:hypothetical protein
VFCRNGIDRVRHFLAVPDDSIIGKLDSLWKLEKLNRQNKDRLLKTDGFDYLAMAGKADPTS